MGTRVKIELHCHTGVKSACAWDMPETLLPALIEAGYGAVFFTEHDDVWPDAQLDALRRDHPGIRIWPGMELTIGQSTIQHLVVLGSNDPGYLRYRVGADVIARARDNGHLTVLAHPFRWPGGGELLETGPLPDAIEHRTCNHDAAQAALSAEAARTLDLRLVNASDCHATTFLDRFWIDTDDEPDTPGDVRDMIVTGRYRNQVRELP